jgi:hypothetical protein
VQTEICESDRGAILIACVFDDAAGIGRPVDDHGDGDNHSANSLKGACCG